MRSAISPLVRPALCVFICISWRSTAYAEAVTGLWEAWDHTHSPRHHWVLELNPDGSVARTQLSDDPDNPMLQSNGSWSLTGTSLEVDVPELQLAPFVVESDSELVQQIDPARKYRRTRQLDPATLYGKWLIRAAGDCSQITLNSDGTYDSNLCGATEHGPFFVFGTGAVHWPIESSKPQLLGVPGLWRDVLVVGDTLRYSFGSPDLGIRVVAVRASSTTSVVRITWGNIKRRTAFPPAE